MNLIEQQNILRGLADSALQGEMQGGTVPPYLVLAEINRRKTARERYEAAVAKRGGDRTVAEELLGKAAPKGIDAMMGQPQAAPAGIEAALPQEQPAFADGGPVGYADGGLADLVSAYNQRLSGMDEDRKMAQKMALMQIGAQIMAGRSRNTLSNVGSGLAAALPGYQQSMERLNMQEMQNLRDQIDLARQMEQDKLAQANAGRDAKLDELRIAAAEEEAKYAGMPTEARILAEEAELKADNPDLYQQMVDARLMANEATTAAEIDKKISDVAADVERQNPIPAYTDKETGQPVFETQAEYEAAVAMRNRIVANAIIDRLRREAGDAAAEAYMSRLRTSAMRNQSPVSAQSGMTLGNEPVIDWENYR